ncbi:DUF3012 domain-containing protein [Microbulbifer taiwanensis]
MVQENGRSPQGEWTLNDASDYTKYCVFNQKPEE